MTNRSWLAAISLLLLLTGSARPQTPMPTLASPEPDTQCAELSKANPDYLPLTKTCQFALQYRRSLPNFICEENIENSPLPPASAPVVIRVTVRYEDGQDSYSNLIVNGKPVNEQNMESVKKISMATTGEFGSQLINLFHPPIVAVFKLRTTSAASAVVVYDFKVAAKDNKLWSIRDTKHLLHPQYEGQLYVDRESGRPVRILARWTKLPSSFQLKSAEIDTQFENVAVSDVGTFILPSRSNAKACVRFRPKLSVETGEPILGNCVQNAMWFSDCHKFVGKSKILLGQPASP